jgi:hypothetical protein
MGSGGRNPTPGEPMELMVDETTGPGIDDLMKRLECQRRDPSLEVAERRSNFAYSRVLPEDRLIDVWILPMIGSRTRPCPTCKASEEFDHLMAVARVVGVPSTKVGY